MKCHHCGAPCREEVLMRGGDHGWGDDASRTVLRYAPPPQPDAERDALSGLLKIAAGLLHVVTHEADELDLPKTTPVTALRAMQRELDRIQDDLRLKAIAIRAATDTLRSRSGGQEGGHG
jgi:hypothetical protein